MKKYFFYTAGVFLMIALPVLIYATPYITLFIIKNAFDNNDFSRVSQYVDYIELRKNLKGKTVLIAGRITKDAAANKTLGSWEESLKSQLIEQAVEQLVTPENLPILIMQILASSDKKRTSVPEQQIEMPSATGSTKDFIRSAEFGYRGFNLFEIRLKYTDKNPVAFIMSRRGWKWKLTDIEF
jgi:hypothetical protein